MPESRIQRDPDDEEDSDYSIFEKKYSSQRWWWDASQALIRLILNVFAGGMIAVGYGDRHMWEQVTAAALIIGNMIWAVYHQRSKRKKVRVILIKDPNDTTPQI